jgi:mono/diheme cytochrome c family protein
MSARQKTFTTFFVAITIAAALGFSVGPIAATKLNAPSPEEVKQIRIKRGEYLVKTSACTDCHTPLKMGPKGPEPDMERFLSGHPENAQMPAPPKLPEGPWVWIGAGTNTAFAGPWGVSYTANLTPDQVTGTGIWTEEMFVKAIRTGRHMGVSRPILPPMPWTVYRNMNDEDLKSIYAYLRTVKPVRNQVPDAVIVQ